MSSPRESLFEGISRGKAHISDDGLYRYSLTRELPPPLPARLPKAVAAVYVPRTCTFVMLNPSTADAEQDDPTIRRCMAFARAWSYTRLKVVNLYAFRATDPRDLWIADDPVGPANDHAISLALGGSDLTIAAWGAHVRVDRLAQFVETFRGWQFYALGLTKHGAPRHPLYMRADVQPVIYDLAAAG